jgi:hypothetical protein
LGGSNVHPTKSTEQPQPSCPPQPSTNPDRIRHSENADPDIEDASEDTEDNEDDFDDDEDSEDEHFQDPSSDLLNAADEDVGRILNVFKAIIESLCKDILKINNRLTTQH